MLHNRMQYVLSNGVLVLQSLRQLVAPTDPDSSGLYVRADNYRIDTYKRSPLLTD